MKSNPGIILLATDLSCRCDRALDRATALAAEWQARLVVLHVLLDPAPVTELPSWRRPLDPILATKERMRRDLRAPEEVRVEFVVERGEPAEHILSAARRLQCGLIVTGVAREETLGRLLLGSTQGALARKAEGPLLIVKTRPRGPFRNIVVATDFSEGSRCALETALRLFPVARVSVFHACDIPGKGWIDDMAAARESAVSHARIECQAFLDATPAVASRGSPVQMYCEFGEVSELLQDLVDARGFDLVVLGNAGRSALASILLGSVAQCLLTSLEVDMLVVRHNASDGGSSAA